MPTTLLPAPLPDFQTSLRPCTTDTNLRTKYFRYAILFDQYQVFKHMIPKL